MTTEFNTGFRISSRCHDGSCVAVADLADGKIAIRDTKNADREPQIYTREEWRAFIVGVKNGEFDFDVLANSPIGSQA